MENISIIVKPNYCTYARYQKQYLQEIIEMLSDLGTVETPEIQMTEGVGVTLWEVVAIYLVSHVAEPFLSQVAAEIANKFVEWITERNRKGQGPIQTTHVTIYGPDEKPLIIVECDRNGNVKQS